MISPVEPVIPTVDQDLAAVCSVVEAAGGAGKVHWAAATLVTSGGRQVILTTDRGRGWMPPGSVVPADVVLPWVHPESARWEGLSDPGRVIVEYAAAVGGHLTALASTYGQPAVAAGMPFAIADPSARAHPEMLIGQVVDRVRLQVPMRHQIEARAITDPQRQREQALWLAIDAHDQAVRAGIEAPGRAAMLNALQADLPRLNHHHWIDALPWVRVDTEYADQVERERAGRIDVRDVPIGEVDTSGSVRRALIDSHATEALLALRNPVAGSALADALYAWSMASELVDVADGSARVLA